MIGAFRVVEVGEEGGKEENCVCVCLCVFCISSVDNVRVQI